MSADFDELRETLREFAQGLIKDRDDQVAKVGIAGAVVEVACAGVARELLSLLDKLSAPTPLTSPDRIPPILRQSLDDYWRHGLKPGAFLSAVLAGDLFGAMAHGDDEARRAAPAIVAYIKQHLPGASWGSYQYVDGWLRRPRS